MKKLLIGLFILGSFSTFANDFFCKLKIKGSYRLGSNYTIYKTVDADSLLNCIELGEEYLGKKIPIVVSADFGQSSKQILKVKKVKFIFRSDKSEVKGTLYH